MNFDTQQALDFLRLFKGRHWLQTFDDRQKNPGRPELVEAAGGESANRNNMLKMADLNAREAGCYFCVNELKIETSRAATNIENIRAFFVDLDGAPLQPVLDCKLKPSIIVQTSADRWHAYWILKEPVAADKKLFRDIQQAIAARFNGDKSITDLCRVMRLPGFYNMKHKPFLVNYLTPNNELMPEHKIYHYSLEEIKNEFGGGDVDTGRTGDWNSSLLRGNSLVYCNDVSLIDILKADAGGGNAWETEEVDKSLLRGALLAISSDDYSIWINVGIALKGAVYKQELDEEAAEEFWHRWSETSDEYDEVIAGGKWEGFNASGEKALGSVFYLAKENGWKGERRNYWSVDDMKRDM